MPGTGDCAGSQGKSPFHSRCGQVSRANVLRSVSTLPVPNTAVVPGFQLLDAHEAGLRVERDQVRGRGRRDQGYVQVEQEGHQSNGETEQGLQHDGRTRGRSEGCSRSTRHAPQEH